MALTSPVGDGLLLDVQVVRDTEALDAFQDLARLEGILPALESAHAVAYARTVAKELGSSGVLLVNLSGRGDKDVNTVEKALGRGESS